MEKLRSISLGISLLATPALAQDAPRPAVRLLPARPMDPVQALTARAASDSGFDPFPSAPPPRNDNARIRNLMNEAKDEESAEPSNWKKFTKWMDDRAKAVKKAITGPPSPQPEPRVGQSENTRRLFDLKKSTSNQPEIPRVNVARPAYGWYGWGTATPGANPYAPTGDYPNGSAQWYAQSGATPGAFPVPTMNPYRPAPGNAPPTYIPPSVAQAQPASAAPPQPSVTRQVPVIPSPRRTIAETPTALPNIAPPMTPAFLPSNQVPVPPPTTDWHNKTSAKPVEPAWRPASATEEMPKPPENNLIVPVIRGADPTFDDSPLARQIHEACHGLVKNVTIRETGPGALTISFEATTATLAEIAVRATSNIIELKPYAVEFAAKVNQ